jgi:hypothetical protein
VGFVVDKAALGQVSSKYLVPLVNHSTNFSIIKITQCWHNRPISGRSAEWTQLDSTPHYTNLKKIKARSNAKVYIRHGATTVTQLNFLFHVRVFFNKYNHRTVTNCFQDVSSVNNREIENLKYKLFKIDPVLEDLNSKEQPLQPEGKHIP